MGGDAEAAPVDSPLVPRPEMLLVCPSHRRVVAVVERDADLDEAASALVTARFGFGGTSPYAPDLVLVNEWAQKGFLEAVMKRTSSLIAGRAVSASGHSRLGSNGELLKRIKSEGKAKAVTEGDFGAVMIVEQRYFCPPISAGSRVKLTANVQRLVPAQGKDTPAMPERPCGDEHGRRHRYDQCVSGALTFLKHPPPPHSALLTSRRRQQTR